MKFKTLTILLVCALAVFASGGCASAASASNAGFTGLWEYPTADMPGDGRGWVAWNNYDPYRSYSLNLGVFPWLEWNIRLTRFATGPIISEGYGRYKDKAMDFKLLLMKQRGFLPAIAIGALDTTGTEIRKAYFGVGTWHFGNEDQFAVSLGYANEAYNGLFGGVSWQATDWLEVKAEYSPLDYTKDRTGSTIIHPLPALSKFNYGVVLKSPWGIGASVSYQRGEELCFGINYQYDLSKPFFNISIPSKKKNNKEETFAASEWKNTDIEQMTEKLHAMLSKDGAGLRNVVILTSERRVLVAFENIGNALQAEAVGGVIVAVSHFLPWDTENISFVPMVRGRAVSRIEVSTEQAALIRLGKINAHDLGHFVRWAPKGKYGVSDDEEWDVMFGPGKSARKGMFEVRIALAYEPRIDRTLFKDYEHRWSIDYIGRVRSSDGWEAYLKVRQPISNTIDIWWEPETTDQTKLWQGVLSYVHKFNERVWAVGEAGWLDVNYVGGNLWGRWYSGNFWAGARAGVTKERDFDSFSGLLDYNRYAGGDNGWEFSWWGQAGYHEKLYDVDMSVSYGKFIHGDKGYRLDASRNWGATSIGFYFTDTDEKTPGKGYTDVGMTLKIPLSAWINGHTSNTVWTQEFTLLSVFLLDAGKMPGAWMPPEYLIGELAPARLEGNLHRMFENFYSGDTPKTQKSDSYGLFELVTGRWKDLEAF